MNYPLRGIRRLECYTVEELAQATKRAPSTIQAWLGDGLPKLDDMRPVLVFGGDYLEWAKAKRGGRPVREPDEFRCQVCGNYQVPKDRIILVDEQDGKPRASGDCSNCGSKFSVFFSLRSLPLLEGKIVVLRE